MTRAETQRREPCHSRPWIGIPRSDGAKTDQMAEFWPLLDFAKNAILLGFHNRKLGRVSCDEGPRQRQKNLRELQGCSAKRPGLRDLFQPSAQATTGLSSDKANAFGRMIFWPPFFWPSNLLASMFWPPNGTRPVSPKTSKTELLDSNY